MVFWAGFVGGVFGVQGAFQGPVLVAVQGAVVVSSGRFQSRHSDTWGNLPWHVQTLIPSIQNTNVYLHTYILVLLLPKATQLSERDRSDH